MQKKSLFEPYTGNESYLYASFHPDDAAIVHGILGSFLDKGYRLYFIDTSQSESLEIAEKIRNCLIFLCFLSPSYVSSTQHTRELNYACSIRKTVIPIKLTDFHVPDPIAFHLGAVPWMDILKEDSSEVIVKQLGKWAPELAHACHGTDLAAKEFKCESPYRKDSSIESAMPVSKSKSRSNSNSSSSFSRKRDKKQPEPETVQKQGLFERLLGRRKDITQKKPGRKGKITEKANFSVISPKAVSPDSFGIVQLHMYTDWTREIVDRAIESAGGMVNETSKTGFEVEEGVSVSVRLESENAKIRDNLETQIWNDRHLLFDFQFYIPAEYAYSQAAFICYIEFNGIPVTRLNFIVFVAKEPDQEMLPARITRNDYSKAFISYCRSDEQRMLARVLGIHELVPEMTFWLDKQSLDAGDVWRDEIKKAILISDILLLFWSVPASKSKEVEKEWQFGLEQRGLSFIAPVPLDPPGACPPPKQLEALNFTVRAFNRNAITEKLTFYNSDNIRLV